MPGCPKHPPLGYPIPMGLVMEAGLSPASLLSCKAHAYTVPPLAHYINKKNLLPEDMYECIPNVEIPLRYQPFCFSTSLPLSKHI